MIPDIVEKNFDTLPKLYKDETSCIDYLERLRWKERIVSPFDPASKIYYCSENRYRCKNSGKYFNVKTNTVFHNTKIPLLKWFMAMSLVNSEKKITSVQLAQKIGITQRSAWFMLQRINGSSAWDVPWAKLSRESIAREQKLQKAEQGATDSKLNMTEWLAYLKTKS